MHTRCMSVCMCVLLIGHRSPMEWSWEGLNIHQTVHAHSLHVSLYVCVANWTSFAHGMELGRSEHPQCMHTRCIYVFTIAYEMELGRSERLPNSACTLVACDARQPGWVGRGQLGVRLLCRVVFEDPVAFSPAPSGPRPDRKG